MGKLYLAYGSNLNRSQMIRRCQDARVKGKVWLNGYELLFRGSEGAAFATIEPCEQGAVPALLWEISARDEASLDVYEGYPVHYRKEVISVEYEGEVVEAMVYIINGGSIEVTSPAYYNIIREGYLDLGFPIAYLRSAAQKGAHWDFGTSGEIG